MNENRGNAPAGWYPVQRGERYWDGTEWTQHTRPVPPPSTAPPSDAGSPTHTIRLRDANVSSPAEVQWSPTTWDPTDQDSDIDRPQAPAVAESATGPKARRASGKILAVAVVVALLLAGGGAVAYSLNERHVSEAHKRAQAQARAATAKRTAEAAAAKTAELKRERHVYQACRSELMPLYNSLRSINSRLNVGLTQTDLGSAVGEASIAYDRIHIHKLGDGACLSAGAKMEDAFNQYVTTSSTWNDCITDIYCDTDTITPGMQRKWAVATRDLGQAQHIMQGLNPDSPRLKRDAAGTIGT